MEKQTEKTNKLTFFDLTWPLKVAVIISWILGSYCLIAFLVGFIYGLVGLI